MEILRNLNFTFTCILVWPFANEDRPDLRREFNMERTPGSGKIQLQKRASFWSMHFGPYRINRRNNPGYHGKPNIGKDGKAGLNRPGWIFSK
jgi:hypothetical protein